MFAARVPTQISRQDLTLNFDDFYKAEKDRGAASPRPKTAVWSYEASAYVCVSFLYALGQSLYDIFQSQQAKQSTRAVIEARTVDVEGDGYLAAYMYAMAMSAYPFAKALSSPYIGHLSDRWGRRKVLVWTLIATAVCLQLCGVAQSYAAVLACRLLTGCVANGGLLTARATDIAADHAQRTRLFSLFTTAWAFARVAAAAIVRLTSVDVRGACRAAALCELAAAALAAVAFTSPEIDAAQQKPKTKTKRAETVKHPVSFRSLAKDMLGERLALMLFVTSLLTPRVDAAAFVSKRFGEGPEAVGVLKALEAVCVVLVSLTPALQAKLVDTFGESGAAVAAAAAVAVGWLGIAAAPSMRALYVLVAARSAFAALYDPAARSLVWARARDTAKRTDATTGSLVGLQQSLKGASQVFGSWLGAYVTSLSVALPLGISAAMMFCNAGVILYECVWREAMRRTQIAEEVLRISASSDGLAQLRKRGLSLEFTRPRGSGSGDGGHPLSRKNSANSSSSSFASPIDMDDDDDGANGGSALPEWLRKSPSKHRPDEEDEDDEDSDDEWPPDEPIVAVFSAYVEKPGDGGAQGRRRCCSKRVRLVCRGDALQWTSSDGPQASSMSSAAEFPPSAWLKADAFEEVDDDVRVSDDDARVHDDGDATADADVGLQARSVGDVATWLRDRGQDAAAAQIVSAGVDGSALAVASVDELHEALGGNVPRLVCRSILLSAKTAFAADGPDGAASNGDGPAGGDSAVARLEHEAGGGLSPRGRAQALALRDGADADAPRLVVVAPHRAAVQTALLAFGSLDNRPAAAAGQRRRRKKREELVLSEPDDDATDGHRPVPIFVAHDAARPRDRAATRKKAGLVIAELHLEYGAQVDFAVCDHARAAVARRERTRSLSHESEDLLNFGGDASPLDEDESRASLARRVYGLLSFLRARAESDIAVVADQHVLDALVSDAARSKSAAVRRPFVAGELRELRVDFFAGADDAPSF